LVLLHIGFEAVIYGIVTVTVVPVDGWSITRSVEGAPLRLGNGRFPKTPMPVFAGLDLKILAKIIPAVLKGAGAA
jgi:hypothetical protein